MSKSWNDVVSDAVALEKVIQEAVVNGDYSEANLVNAWAGFNTLSQDLREVLYPNGMMSSSAGKTCPDDCKEKLTAALGSIQSHLKMAKPPARGDATGKIDWTKILGLVQTLLPILANLLG